MPAERGGDAAARRGIIDREGIAIQRRYVRWPGGAGGRGLGVDDPFDRSEHAPAHPLIEAAHVELDDGFVGDTFSLAAACNEPMVTTAASAAASSRETMVCKRMTVAAAITTGSTLARGIDPFAPRPNNRICRLSPAEVMTPSRPPIAPAGPTITCWPSTTSMRQTLP